MKKVLSLFLSCIFVLGVCFSTPIVASAAEEDVTFTSEGVNEVFTYKVLSGQENEKPTCALTNYTYTGNEPVTVVVAQEVQDDNQQQYRITEIVDGAFANCTAIKAFSVDGNQHFSIDDDVLFNSDGTKLIAYPAAKVDGEENKVTEYVIPEGVTEVATGAFAGSSATLVLEASDPRKITTNPDGLVIHNVFEEGHAVSGYVVNGNEIKSVCTCEIELETIATIECIGSYTDDNSKNWAKEVKVLAKYGEFVSKNSQDDFSDTVTFTQNDKADDGSISFCIKQSENAESTEIRVELNSELDSTTPTGEITLEETSWNEYLNNVTFDLFYKEAKTVTITSADENGSGVKSVEYYISEINMSLESLEALEKSAWTELILDDGSADVNLKPNLKNIVYVKITDNTGNVNYISSNGIVLYSDSTADTETIEITYKGDVDKEVTVTLNGNEINSVTCDKGEFEISDYTVDSNKITLKGEYLKTLAADEYTYTVSYNPLGVDFVSGTNNNEPATTTFKVIVNKADITGATLPEAITGLVYDGSQKDLVSAGKIAEGTVQYRLSENENWSDTVPTGINAGNYTVYYKISLGENYNDITGSIPVNIDRKTIEEASVELEKTFVTYNGQTQIPVVEIQGLIHATDYTVDVVRSDGEREDFVNVGTFTVSVNGIGNYSGTITKTYEIKKAPLTITAKDVKVIKNSENPALSEFVVGNGLVTGDKVESVQLETTLLNTETVGDYNITVSNAVIKREAVDVTSNYEITYVNGKLSVVLCETHSWKDGVCEVCETACEHTWKDGKCDVCKTVCQHATWKDGVCEVCKIACEHEGGTATCYAKAVCEICNTSYGETTAHKMTGTKMETYPTCSKEGSIKYYCKNEGCTHFVIEPIEKDPENHDWANGTRETTTKPTCKTEGVITITCANGCGKTTTEAIPVVADAHVLSGWAETPATCVKEGEKSRVCMEEGCDYKETEVIEINKDAHDMTGEWEVVKEVTCVTDGEKELKCKNEGCTHKVTEVVKADGESHNLSGWKITVEAKCTVEGEIAKLCQNEGCTYKEALPLDPDGINHDPAEEFTVVPATCISAGEKYKKCQNPDCTAKLELEELPIDPEAHVNTEVLNAKEPTCLEEGYTGDTFCKDCEKTIASGVVVDATGHTASEWIVDKEATFEEDGAQHKECTVCKEELQKAVIEKRSLDTPVVKIENAGNGIKVTWSQDEDATGYTVYRSTYNAKTKKWSKWVNRGTADATKSSWVDKKVEHGVTYKFTVRAINDKYKSAYKETDALLYIVAPKVTCSITSTGIIVNWNKIDNADSYDVYRSVLVDGAWVKWTKIGSTKAEKNTFLDDKVESGVNYKYTVRVVDGKVKSGYVSSASIIYLGQPVLKITNSANGVTGNWEKIEGATGYTIYRSEYNPSIKKWTKWLNLGTTKATAKSFTDKTVKSGYKYKYTIRAINGKLKSTYEDSNQLIFLTQPTLTIANTASGIQGKWNKVDGATGYILYRSELKEDGSWTKWITLGTAKATAKSFTDKTVKSGVQYKYTIRAKNGNYKSSYIDSNTSIFLGIPTVKIANAETGVKVSWSKIEGATSYLVYRSEYNSSTKKWSGWKTLETVDTTSFVDETAVSNVKYKYTVRALNGKFRSYFTASTELLYLKAPTVTAEKTDEGIKVSWTKIEGATSYIIYRSELSEDGKWSKWTKLGTAGEKYTSCKDKTVKENVTYKYTVRAVSGKLMSYYVASEQILNGVVTESIPEEPKTDVVA